MKHLHFDVETAGFYGAYWACAGGSDCAVIAMIGGDPEDRLARSAAKWLCGRGVNVLTMSPAKKDYGHHNYPLERVETAISWLKANGNQKIGIAGASTTGTLALTAAVAADGGAADASLCRLRGVLLQGGAGMTGVMGEILEHYGQTVTLRSRDGEKSVRAFIQPAAARDETVPGEQTSIGWIDERLWRYTGLEEVQPGDTVIWRGRSFRVRSSREHALSDEINHWWALLEPERTAAE